jgi:uncharacterized protein (DUF1800 family)
VRRCRGGVQVLEPGPKDAASAPVDSDERPTPEARSTQDVAAPVRGARVAMLASTFALGACGGDGSGPVASPPSPPPVASPPPPPSITAAQASRFLAQATMGTTRTAISDVRSMGYSAWISAQFGMKRATTHWDWLVASGYNVSGNINNQAGFDATLWRQMIVEPDQLRQRIGFALLDMLVVGIDGVNLNWKQFAVAAYVDVLLDNAFGNYRTILEAITTNAAMGSFLTFLNNRKANAATGAMPDENYARELMQLFALGLYRLNADGTLVSSGGAAVETYGQSDVSQLARIFTGLQLASSDSTTPDRYRLPLVMNSALNETGTSTFLGATVSGGGMAAIKAALDTIFAHPNLPPFVSRQLIQRLVTSNPSPAYVGRVSAAFADNGGGVRGDMKAVIRAILLDDEARSDAALSSASAGKLREPVIRLTNWARAFGATSASDAWAIGDTSSASTRLAQSAGRSQTVFNFFRPGYVPANTGISAAGLVAPEFQLANEQSVVAYVNFMQLVVADTIGDVKADYSDLTSIAADSAALVDEVNLRLAANQLSAATVTAIRSAVDSVAPTTTNGPVNRAAIAILLTLASPDYLVLR